MILCRSTKEILYNAFTMCCMIMLHYLSLCCVCLNVVLTTVDLKMKELGE